MLVKNGGFVHFAKSIHPCSLCRLTRVELVALFTFSVCQRIAPPHDSVSCLILSQTSPGFYVSAV